MMNRAVSGACGHLHKSPSEKHTAIVLGAKECTDVPMDMLARDGFVYLVDVDVESPRVAKSMLADSSLQDRVEIVCMDASLFETALLDQAQSLLKKDPSDIDRAFRAVIRMNREAVAKSQGLFTDAQLPIRKNSVDLTVSSMTLSQFMIGYVQLLVKMFLDLFGRKKTQGYFLSGPQGGDGLDGSQRAVELLHAAYPLTRKAAEKHVLELGRITKPDGVVVLSDHALHGRCTMITEDQVEVDLHSLIPYSKNPKEERALRFREDRRRRLPASLRVDRTRPDQRFVVEGADALKNILEQDGRMEILDEQGWWWVTERANGAAEGFPSWYISYVEAFILRPKA
jgi:hypothetical protein